MRVLIVVATAIEAQWIREALDQKRAQPGVEIAYCMTGPGLLFTAARLSETVCLSPPDFALQLGIAGTFGGLENGDLVAVASEQLADVGAENHPEGFLDLFELGLMEDTFPEFAEKRLVNPLAAGRIESDLRWVDGVSVNVCTGTGKTAEFRKNRYGTAIETMEGAAFHYVCLRHKIPFLQLRGISNVAGIRDKASWDIEGAMASIRQWLSNDFFRFLTSFQNAQAL